MCQVNKIITSGGRQWTTPGGAESARWGLTSSCSSSPNVSSRMGGSLHSAHAQITT